MNDCIGVFSLSASLPYGLVVRIPGFHPGGPGSIPGVGTFLKAHIIISYASYYSIRSSQFSYVS